MPKSGDDVMQFTSVHFQHKVPYVIYADLECLLVPIASTSPSTSNSYERKLAQHTPCGYSFLIVDEEGHSERPISVYRGENAIEHFLTSILKVREELSLKLEKNVPLHLTPSEEQQFQQATHCSICGKSLHADRVRDHNHLSGKFRGAAHNHCNLQYQLRKFIPVIFHNLSNYDGHHLMQHLGKFKNINIIPIATTLEKYISFRVSKENSPTHLIFLDSFKFLPSSLEKLSANLAETDFKLLKENFPPGTDFSLLTQKGVYPYDFFSSFAKFEEKELPPIEGFFNVLKGETVSVEEYAHAVKIWKTFDMTNMGCYHDLYVKTDVLLLADIFQNFRSLCETYYQLDPCHMQTAPGLSFQACMKMSDFPLQLLQDENMFLFVEKGVRGGVSQISKRFARANNRYMTNYNPLEPESYIMYYDANNLYGWSMSQMLPYGGFEWVNPDSIDVNFILNLKDEASEGFFFEVDLFYCESLHQLHNLYPVAPQKMKVEDAMLSEYARSFLPEGKAYKGATKLIPHLGPRKNYVIHYRTLKYYLQLGLKLEKIHKALKFQQCAWLKKYIQFNTEKRKEAKTPFERDFFKLLNNSIYGKTLENLRARSNIELCNSQVRAEKLAASPLIQAFKIFENDLVAVKRRKNTIYMNRPIYVGFAILELSKLLMYQFHYGYMMKKYPENCDLLFTDTDSLCYHIQTPDIYQDMQQDSHYFDFSEYPKSHFLFSEENKKVLGKMKDEMSGAIIQEFCGVKAKMYSILSQNFKEKKRAKGICKNVVEKELQHKDYVECIFKRKTTYQVQKKIGQQNHQLYTLEQNKLCLSAFDDKRFLLSDGVHSLAYGHYQI